ncbi:hypothetical protein Tco_1292289 [Tanacetum coccineum]
MTTVAQQIALDNALVAPENQRGIDKSNVPVIYMHHFWATVNKHNASYRFKIDNKRFSVNVEVFREIHNICLKIPGQKFDAPPSEEETLSFIRELGHSKEIKYITNIDNKDSKKQDKMFYPRFTKAIIHHFLTKDKSISMRNRTFMHTARDDSLLGTIRFENPSKKKPAKAKKNVPSTKKPATKPKLTKKKAPAKVDRGKGLNVLSEVALFKVAQLKEVTKQSKKDFYMSHASGSGDRTDFESRVLDEQQRKISGTDEGIGTKPGVLDVPKYDYESEKESWGDSGEEEDNDEDDTKEESDNDGNDDDGDNDDNDDDGDNDDNDDESDHERIESDRDENPNLNQSNKDHEEEEDKYVNEFTDEEDNADNAKEENEEEIDDAEELYRDVNVEEDAHVILTTVHDTQKTEGPMQSSSVSSDFTDKLLNFEKASLTDNKIASLIDTTIRHEEPNGQKSYRTTTPTPTPTTSEVTTSFPTLPDFSSVFKFNDRVTNLEKDLSKMKKVNRDQALADKKECIDLIDTSVRAIIKEDALVKSYNTDKDLFETYGKIFTLKRSRDDKDKDQDPFVGSDRGTKRKKSSKEAESSRDPKSKESKSSSSSKSTSCSQHKSSGKSAVTPHQGENARCNISINITQDDR